MHKLFLAVMVSCILLLFTAAGLFMTLTKDTTAVQKTTFGDDPPAAALRGLSEARSPHVSCK